MISLNKRWAWCAAFVVVSAACAWAGARWGQHTAGLDLMCTAESVYAQRGAKQSELVLARLSVDLNKDKLSYLRMAIERVDTDQGRITDVMQRYSTFTAKREGDRLLVQVKEAGKGQTDTQLPFEYPRLGLFIFQPGSSLSYHLRVLDESHYLIENGTELIVLCNRNRDVVADKSSETRPSTL